MVIRKLALSNLLVHRTRTLLTGAAIALSVSLVVAVTSGYASVEAMAYRFTARYMGTADAVITRRGLASGFFAESIVDQFRADPDVKRVTGRLEADNQNTDEKGRRTSSISPAFADRLIRGWKIWNPQKANGSTPLMAMWW